MDELSEIQSLRRELEQTGLPFTLTDLTVPETQQKNALLELPRPPAFPPAMGESLAANLPDCVTEMERAA